MNIKQRYIERYAELRLVLAKTLNPDSLAQRDWAMDRFAAQGFPGKHLEHYKYTSTEPLFEPQLHMDMECLATNIMIDNDFHCDIYNIDSYEVFVGNGCYRKHKHQLPKGVILCSIKEALEQHPDLFRKYSNQQAQHADDGLVALNTAFALDGLFLYVPKQVVLDKPIQLINVFRSDCDTLVNQRNLFIIEEGARAKVLVRDHSLSSVHFVANVVNEIHAHAHAHFDCYAIQYVNNQTSLINHYFVTQEAHSEVLTNNITLNGGTVRNNVYTTLNGEHASSFTYGLSLPEGKQHVDNYCKIIHQKPNCSSFQLYKNILSDESNVVFCGHILVQPDAQHTDARQNNKNICLSPMAHVYTKPQLEIYADDVKCSHGATIGQLDEQALFYLRARGIPKKEAQLLLLSAFTHEAIEHVRIEDLKVQLHDLVEKRFRGELSRCYNCKECKVLSC